MASPKDPHNNHALNTAFKEDKYQELILDDLGPIAKGTWSPSKDDTTGWAAGYRRYGASKLCGVTMMYTTPFLLRFLFYYCPSS